MKYRKIMPKIWYQLENLNSDCKVLAFYCLTSPQVNRIGFYRFSEALACESLKLSMNTFQKSLETVCQTFDWKFDKKSKMILIPSWFKFNAPENQSVLKSYIKEFEDLPLSSLTSEFLTVCERYAIPFPHGVLDCVPHGVPHPEPEPEPNPNQTITNPEPEIYNEIFDTFGTVCKDLPALKDRNHKRKSLIKSRSRSLTDIVQWREFFERVQSSDWLCGRNPKTDGWNASFDWILKESNFIKILEGNYDNRKVEAKKDKTFITAEEADKRRAEIDAQLQIVRERKKHESSQN